MFPPRAEPERFWCLPSREHPSAFPPGHPSPWEREEPCRGDYGGKDNAAADDASSSSTSAPTPKAGTPRRASAPGFSQQGMGCPHPTSQRGDSQAHPAPAQGGVGWDNSFPLPPLLCMSTAGYLFIFMSFLQPGPIVKA